MATTITIAGTEVDFNDFSIEIPLSPEGVVPTAEVETNVNESVTAGDSVVIDDGGATIFEGEADSGGTKERGGRLRVKATHDAIKLFEESVSLNETGPPTGSQVLQAAVDASSVTADVTLSYPSGGAALSDDYVVEDRQILSIFRDMTDAAGDVWWVDPAGDTITVEAPGNQGQWRTFDTTQDAALVRSFDTGSVDTVRNDVTVNGTGAEKVVGTDSDSTSISTYGTRSEVYNLSWVTSQFQADAIATELLIPDPLPEGELLVGTRAGDATTPRVNQTVDVDDSAKSISEDGLIIEKQTIEQQRTELAVGQGSGVSLENFNRQGRSRGDITEPGSVYNSDRLADGSVDTDQIADRAIDNQKVKISGIIAENLADSSVETAKIAQAAIKEEKIETGEIGATRLFITDWIPIGLDFTDNDPGAGEISWPSHELVYDGTTYNISADSTSDRYVFWREGDGFYSSTGTTPDDKPTLFSDDALVAINENGEANEILQATEIHGGTIRTNTINAAEINTGVITTDLLDADAITADVIDTLALQTDQLSIIDDDDGTALDVGWKFDTVNVGNGVARFIPQGGAAIIGSESDTSLRPDCYLGAVEMSEDLTMAGFSPIIAPDGDNEGSLGTDNRSWNEVYADSYLDSSGDSITTDGGDPLAGLATGAGPPEHTVKTTDDGERIGTDIGELAHTVMDIAREQQRRIEALEDRISQLEQQT